MSDRPELTSVQASHRSPVSRIAERALDTRFYRCFRKEMYEAAADSCSRTADERALADFLTPPLTRASQRPGRQCIRHVTCDSQLAADEFSLAKGDNERIHAVVGERAIEHRQ